MKRLFIATWLTLPVAAYAYHMGPGQDHLRLDGAATLIASADAHAAEAVRLTATEGEIAARGEWFDAEAEYAEALSLLPGERVGDVRRIKLERAKAQMNISKLPDANASLAGLVTELLEDPNADPALLADTQRTFATSQYYLTWLLRLEGAAREDWEPHIDSARQTYKLLASQAEATGAEGSEVIKAREDLESAIRLARMDLSELQGLPLPSQ
jgi:hypothetical protein